MLRIHNHKLISYPDMVATPVLNFLLQPHAVTPMLGHLLNTITYLYLTDSQMGSGQPNYLFPLSLYASYTCYFPLNPAFCLQKRDIKIPIPV